MHGKPRRVVDLRCISKTRSSQALEGLPAGPQEHWARCRQQTRDRALEQSVLRRQQRGTWLLAAGEGLDWQHIRNEFYTASTLLGEVSLDHCLEAFRGARLLDLGCGVGALLARLKRHEAELDWAKSLGVTSVHTSDVSMFAAPPGDPDFFEAHLLRFNLDSLAEHAEKELASRRFDVITSHYCWCHLLDPLGALVCAFSLLAAGGVLLIIEPLHEPSNSLPYTDHRLYHWVDGTAVSMRQLLQHWQKEVAIFFALEQGTERKHVLALRKHAEQQELSLPVALRPGATDLPMKELKHLRLLKGDLEAFVTPSARSFPEWLQKAKMQRLAF